MKINEKKNNNLIIIILGIIIILLLAILIFMYLNQNKTKKETINAANTTTNDKSKYINYTSKKIKLLDESMDADTSYTLLLEIKNGKLIATEDSSEIQVSGLSGKIKSFTVSDNVEEVLVINDNNDVFHSLIGSKGEGLEFTKLKTNEKIKDITLAKINNKVHGTAVVLTNNEVRQIIQSADDASYIIDTENFNNISYILGDTVDIFAVYKDKTVKYITGFGEKKAVKYNDLNLDISKIYLEVGGYAYALDNNGLLYQIDLQDIEGVKLDVTLVDKKQVVNVKKTTYNEYKKNNVDNLHLSETFNGNFDDAFVFTFTFSDGNSIDLGVYENYSLK